MVVPVCRSWPGLRDWVLCITSCSLRNIRDIKNRPPPRLPPVPGYNNEESKVEKLRIEPEEDEGGEHLFSDIGSWFSTAFRSSDSELVLLRRFRTHLTACIALTTTMGTITEGHTDYAGRERGGVNLSMFKGPVLNTPTGPWLDPAEPFERGNVSSRRCPRLLLNF